MEASLLKGRCNTEPRRDPCTKAAHILMLFWTEEWYPNDDSTNAQASASKSPTYPVLLFIKVNICDVPHCANRGDSRRTLTNAYPILFHTMDIKARNAKVQDQAIAVLGATQHYDWMP